MATPADLGLAGVDLPLLALFGAGAFIMRGAGCTINDMLDSEFDRKVKRTAGRPIASRRVSQRQALAFLAAQLSAGLLVLVYVRFSAFFSGLVFPHHPPIHTICNIFQP